MPHSLIQAALAVSPPPSETTAVHAIAHLAQQLKYRVWAAGHGSQYQLAGKYDVSWGQAASSMPSTLTQVKTGGVHQEDQEVYEFLNDVLTAGYDFLSVVKGTRVFCVAVVHNLAVAKFWGPLGQLRGPVTLRMEPIKAAPRSAGRVLPNAWIDQGTNTVAPYTKTQIDQIFSGTQKAKYRGLYERPGIVAVAVEAALLPCGAPQGLFHAVVWEIKGFALSDTALPPSHWFP